MKHSLHMAIIMLITRLKVSSNNSQVVFNEKCIDCPTALHNPNTQSGYTLKTWTRSGILEGLGPCPSPPNWPSPSVLTGGHCCLDFCCSVQYWLLVQCLVFIGNLQFGQFLFSLLNYLKSTYIVVKTIINKIANLSICPPNNLQHQVTLPFSLDWWALLFFSAFFGGL